jgi:hypothetical protein
VTRCLLFKVLITTNFITTNFITTNFITTNFITTNFITTNFITTNFIAANLIDTPNSTTMESIEEQWDPEPSSDIISKSWPNIANAKTVIKIWILDRGES